MERSVKVLNSNETLAVSGGIVVPFIAGAAVGGFTVDALHGGVCLGISQVTWSATQTVFAYGVYKTVQTYNYLFPSTKTEPVTTFIPVTAE